MSKVLNWFSNIFFLPQWFMLNSSRLRSFLFIQLNDSPESYYPFTWVIIYKVKSRGTQWQLTVFNSFQIFLLSCKKENKNLASVGREVRKPLFGPLICRGLFHRFSLQASSQKRLDQKEFCVQGGLGSVIFHVCLLEIYRAYDLLGTLRNPTGKKPICLAQYSPTLFS